MTSAEEKLCLKRCRKGDPEAKRILIEHNLRLVAHVAKKYQNTGEDLEDLISIGTIGLIKAISTFDIDRSGTDKEGNEISLLDIIESPPVDVIENYSTQQDILHLLSSIKSILSPKEYQVICYRYGIFNEPELTQREIAARLDISRSYVSRIEKNALKKLRTLFH